MGAGEAINQKFREWHPEDDAFTRDQIEAYRNPVPVPESEMPPQPEAVAETPVEFPSDWPLSASCRGDDTKKYLGTPTEPSKQVCGACVVVTPCLEEALAQPAHRDIGFRGGMSAAARNKIRKARKKAAEA